MRKATIVAMFILCLALTACGREPVIEPVASALSEIAEPTASPIDLDLSNLSATFVYAQVYEMFMNPEDYIGKKIKIRGDYYDFTDPDSGQVYTAVIIIDNTACCELGLEFVLDETYVYPDDYPTSGDVVTITGVFGTYAEGENLYCHLTGGVLD